MKIAIIGFGQMGKAISEMAVLQGDEIVLRINSPDDLNLLETSEADVAIEFSTPESAFQNIVSCFRQSIPVVCGTTGWLAKKDEILRIREELNGTFFYASNFSLGMNIVFMMNQYLAGIMDQFPQFSASMEEIHHINKIDAPSGTAKTLADDLVNILNRYSGWSLDPSGQENLIHIESLREGEVPGTHTVKYQSSDEKITLTHEAFNRDVFARGALVAARWIHGRKGAFSFSDLLNFANPK